MIDFGLVLPIQVKGLTLDRLWQELKETLVAAELAGFDAVFLPEFHQAQGGALVSPMLLGAGLEAIARFGTEVIGRV